MLPKLESHRGHGDLVRHQGRHQEEVEDGLEEEVERRVRREHTQETKHRCACMNDMDDTHGETLSQKCDV